MRRRRSATPAAAPTRYIAATDSGLSRDWAELWEEYLCDLKLDNKSERTIQSYFEALSLLHNFLARLGDPPAPTAVTTADIKHFLLHLREDRDNSGDTLNQRRRSVSPFFTWLKNAGEIKENPVKGSPSPKLDDVITEALSPEEFAHWLAYCDAQAEYNPKIAVRNKAIVLAFYDTGLRRAEFCSLDVDPTRRYERLRVMGKGRKERYTRFGLETTRAVLRYTRRWGIREGPLWRSQQGGERITENGLYNIFRRMSRDPKLDLHVYPHLLRHSFTNDMLDTDAPRDAIVTLGGWEPRTAAQMLDRYGKSRKGERALDVHREYSPVDRLLGKR